MRRSPRFSTVPTLASVVALLVGCSDGDGARAGARTNPGTQSSAGAAGAGGTEQAGGAGSGVGTGGGGSGAGGSRIEHDFASAFYGQTGTYAPCTDCLRAECPSENAACGDITTGGSGACAPFANCLGTEYQEADPTYDCSFELCLAAHPQDAPKSVSTCLQARCAKACFVTPMFASCDR